MTPNPDDPLFRMFCNAVDRAGIRSIPVESTWERDVLDAHEFNPECEAESAHLISAFGHQGPATHMCTTPCGNDIMLCAGSVEHMRTTVARTYCACGSSHPNKEFLFTPLPEGNR